MPHRNDLADHAPHGKLINEDLIPVVVRDGVRKELGAIRIKRHLASDG